MIDTSSVEYYSIQAKGFINVKQFVRKNSPTRPCFLETRVLDNNYGKQDLFFYDPPLMIRGKNKKVEIIALNERADIYINFFVPEDKRGKTILEYDVCYEYLQWLIPHMKNSPLENMGIYGAIGYDFMRFFQGLDYQNENDDFIFYFPDYLFKQETYSNSYTYEALIFPGKTECLKNIPALLGAVKDDDHKVNFHIHEPYLEDEDKCLSVLEKGKQHIDDGEVSQLTLSRTYSAKYEGSPFDIYCLYSKSNPTTYNYFFDFKEFGLMGASIATLLKLKGGHLISRAIGGTIARKDHNYAEQYRDIADFIVSEKEKKELDMLIDIARNDIAKISGRLPQITDYRRLSYFSKVIHSYADISTPIEKPIDITKSIGQCMPAATISGYPRRQSIKLIHDIEDSSRSFYGGGVGRIMFDQEFDIALSIRGVEFNNNNLKFRVGSSLVSNSNVKKEFAEGELKAKGFLDALNSQLQAKTEQQKMPLDIKIFIYDEYGQKSALYKSFFTNTVNNIQAADVIIVTSCSDSKVNQFANEGKPVIFIGEATYSILHHKYIDEIVKEELGKDLYWTYDNNVFRIDGIYNSWLYRKMENSQLEGIGKTLSSGINKNYDLVYLLDGKSLACVFDPLSTGIAQDRNSFRIFEEIFKLLKLKVNNEQ